MESRSTLGLVRSAQDWASEGLCDLGQVSQPLWAFSDTLWQHLLETMVLR